MAKKNEGVLDSIARTVGTTAGIIMVKANELTAKAASISKSVQPKKAAKKSPAKKKEKPAIKRKVVAKKKARKPVAKKRK
jgi:hypothetical protein